MRAAYRPLLPLLLAASAAWALPPPVAHPRSVESAEQPLRQSPLTPDLFFQILLGELQLRDRAYGDAYELFLGAARSSRDEALYQRAVEVALQARAGEQALTATRAWRQAQPKSQRALQTEAQILLSMQRGEEALKPLSTLLQRHGEADQALLLPTLPAEFRHFPQKGQVLGWVSQLARPALSQARLANAAHTAIAGAAWDAQQLETAWSHLLRLNPSQPIPHQAVALSVNMLPHQGLAQVGPVVQKWLDQASNALVLRPPWIDGLRTQKHRQAALEQARQLTRLQPLRVSPLLMQGLILQEMGRCREALPVLATALRKDADDPQADAVERRDEAHLASVDCALALDDLARARAHVEALGPDVPESTRAHWQARLLLAQARTDAERLAALTPLAELPTTGSFTPAQRLQAQFEVLSAARQWNLAFAWLRDLPLTDASLETTRLFLQAHAGQAGDHLDESIALYRRLLQIQPDSPSVMNALAYTLAEHGRSLDEARRLLDTAHRLQPQDPAIMDSLGWVMFRQGHLTDAETWIRRAWQRLRDPEVAAHLGEVLWALGQRSAARAAWAEALQDFPEHRLILDAQKRLERP